MKPFSEATLGEKILIVIGVVSIFVGVSALLSETDHVIWFVSITSLLRLVSAVMLPFALVGVVGLIARWVYLAREDRLVKSGFVRSRTDLRVGGVCGGVASYIQTSSILVRLVALSLLLVNPVMFLVVYALLLIASPLSSH